MSRYTNLTWAKRVFSISVKTQIEDSRYRNAWIAPSLAPNSDLVLLLSILVQGMIILGVARVIYYQRHKTEIQTTKADKSKKSNKFSAWMDDRQDQD